MNILDLIIHDLKKNNLLHKYVIFRKDDKGYYLEYAFTEGAPHDNRCIDWYCSYQENAYIRNGWVDNMSEEDRKHRLEGIRRKIDSKVGKLFTLGSFTCGCEENQKERLKHAKKFWDDFYPDVPFVPEDHICKVGCPSKKCDLKDWTYEEPVKCACWNPYDMTTMEEFIANYTIKMKASELLDILNSSNVSIN